MNKKFLFITALVVSMLVLGGCGKKPSDSHKETISADESVFQTESTSQTEPTQESTAEEEDPAVILANRKKECEEALNSIRVSVASATVVDYEDGCINGYMCHSEDYEKATILTLCIEFDRNTYSSFFDRLTVCGETATGPDGECAVQTSYTTVWTNNAMNCMLMVVRVGGEVDPSKAEVLIKGKVEDTCVTKKFENNGEEIGFDTLSAAFASEEFGCGSSIVKLMGRHYIIVQCYNSIDGWRSSHGEHYSYKIRSFILNQIEDGFKRTLTSDDVKIIDSDEVPNTTIEVKANEGEGLDASSMQSAILVKVERHVVEPQDETGDYSDEVFDQVDADIQTVLESAVIGIDDGDGNLVQMRLY